MSRWKNKYVIGLTGNIATGKSVVRKMLQHLGAYTIDADGLSHAAMQPGAPAYQPIVNLFGGFILNENQEIDRAKLGAIVFSNPQALRQLEAITHPVIRKAIHALVERAKQRVIVIEAIKLIEGELANDVDAIWVVNATPETQLVRLIKTRNMEEAAARQRIAAQNPQREKVARAQVVIQNDGNVDETWKQVQQHWNGVKQAVLGVGQAKAPDGSPSSQRATSVGARMDETMTVDAYQDPDATVPTNVQVRIKRGMPPNAEGIAKFISAQTKRTISRMDVMMSFGQRSYLIAENEKAEVIGVVGWQVENLITRVEEIQIAPGYPTTLVMGQLIQAMEKASEDLQSEVAFVFLNANDVALYAGHFARYGYETTTIKEIKIPAWREAVQETLNQHGGNLTILNKKLREDRILKPI
ncbi:MAG: dephospho-CoA kinase [Phototrophicaceae bacterium]